MRDVLVADADLADSARARDVLDLICAYARDPMGDGKELDGRVQRDLIEGLRRHPTTRIYVAYQDIAVGIAVCFLGFSTFAARPLLNIHDFYVRPSHRGMGIGRLLLAIVEQRARNMGCCRLTLEVQQNNRRAQKLYRAAGFEQALYEPEAGPSQFWRKPLD